MPFHTHTHTVIINKSIWILENTKCEYASAAPISLADNCLINVGSFAQITLKKLIFKVIQKTGFL